MGKSKRRVRAGHRKHRITHRVTKRTNKRSTFRANKRSKSRRGGKRTRSRRKMSGGGKMNKMTLSQQFILRDDLRQAKNALTQKQFLEALNVLDKMETEAEQLEGLAILGKLFYKPPPGRLTTDHTTGKKFWCPHGITCMTDNECHDFEEHQQAKGRD
jgi:hypothetical protein